MMRKIKTLYSRTLLLRAMACGLILTVLLNLAGFSAQCAALEENIVRLHVIANSNDEADQAVKLRVRDAVLREAEQWYGDAEDFDTAVTALCTHLESLEAAANSVLKAENLPYCAKAEICKMYFPTRTYESFKLPAGRYRTLRISLGKAEGKNWWCVVFRRCACPVQATYPTCLMIPIHSCVNRKTTKSNSRWRKFSHVSANSLTRERTCAKIRAV